MTKTEMILKKLDEVIENGKWEEYITKHPFFDSSMLANELLGDYPASLITKVIKEMLNRIEGKKTLTVRVDDEMSQRKTYFTFCDYDNTGTIEYIGKEKSVLNFIFHCSKDIEVHFDFKDNSLDFDKEKYTCVKKDCDDYNYLFFSSLLEYNECIIPEWVFSYLTTIEELASVQCDCYGSNSFKKLNGINYSLFQECPKGYIQYLKHNGRYLNFESLKEYLSLLKYGKLGHALLEYFKYSVDRDTLLENMNELLKLKPVIFKILKNSWNKGEELQTSVSGIYGKILGYYRFIKDDLNTILSETDTVQTFTTKAEKAKDKEYNKKLSPQLQKLNFLNNLIIQDKYIVKVPQVLKDLQTEGNNQSNCVGSFYNNSIIEGENLIYFLRNKDNPETSLVTCRFGIKDNKTVEARRKNNSYIIRSDENAIEEIDKIIRKHFKKGE